MTKRNYKMFIEDILESIEKIESYIKGLNYEKFTSKGMTVDAVIRNLEIIGEASRNIPDEMRERNPEIPWKKMVGLRNIATHAYFGVDLEIIWEIITKNLPETKNQIRKTLNP